MALLLVSSPLVSCTPQYSANSETVTVFAAASLVDAFTEIGAAFEAANPGSTVEFNFASSSDLANQIVEGASADVFASADSKNIDKLRTGDVPFSAPHVFATNTLEIIVEVGNPFEIQSLADLSDSNLTYVTCDESVPIGRYSSQILATAGVEVSPASFEEHVKGIVNKIALGEADAGIVYRTDVIAAGSAVEGVPIPNEFNVTAEYPAVAIGPAPSGLTQEFLAFITSPAARTILTMYGFGAP